MDGESYPLPGAMHSQSSCPLPDLAEKTAALEIAKVAESTETKPWDTKMLNTSPGDSVFRGPGELETETAPQVLKGRGGTVSRSPFWTRSDYHQNGYKPEETQQRTTRSDRS